MLKVLYLRFRLRLCRCSYVKNSTTIEINNPQYKYAHEACLQFLTLVGESPKWNILVIPWTLVLYVIYTHLHSGARTYISHKVLMPMV